MNKFFMFLYFNRDGFTLSNVILMYSSSDILELKTWLKLLPMLSKIHCYFN